MDAVATPAPAAAIPAAPSPSDGSDPIFDAIAGHAADLGGDADTPSLDDLGAAIDAAKSDETETPVAPATEPVTQDGKPDVKPEIRGRISRKEHQEVLTRQREKQAAEHAKALKAVQDQLEQLKWAQTDEGKAQFWLDTLDHARDPEVLARAFAEHPTYGKYLQLKQAQAEAQARIETPPSAADHPFGPAPNPYVDMGNGQYALSQDGMEKYTAWVSDVSAWNATQKAKAEFDARLGPIEQREKAAQKYGETYQRVSQELNHARANWPFFKEHEADIKPLVGTKGKLSLVQGYAQILVSKVIPSLQQKVTDLEGQVKVNRDQVRQDVIAELNQKAGAAGERVDQGPSVAGTAQGSGDPIEAAIRQQARRLRSVA